MPINTKIANGWNLSVVNKTPHHCHLPSVSNIMSPLVNQEVSDFTLQTMVTQWRHQCTGIWITNAQQKCIWITNVQVFNSWIRTFLATLLLHRPPGNGDNYFIWRSLDIACLFNATEYILPLPGTGITWCFSTTWYFNTSKYYRTFQYCLQIDSDIWPLSTKAQSHVIYCWQVVGVVILLWHFNTLPWTEGLSCMLDWQLLIHSTRKVNSFDQTILSKTERPQSRWQKSCPLH